MQLVGLCKELRSAWEDVSMRERGGPDLSDEREQDLLMKLSEDASLQIPYAWSNASSVYHHHMDTSSDAEDSPPRSSKRSFAESKLGRQFHGKLRDRRRPTSRTSSAFPPSSFLPPSAPPHDVLSLLALLTRTRHALVNLFALVVIPALKERLPPTFALWATTNALGWCRRTSIREGAEVAQLMVQLLEDDGSIDDSGSEQETDVDDSEDEEAGKMGEAIEDRRERRKRRNVLYQMQDDWSLRMRCENAREKAAQLDDDGDLGDGGLTGETRPWEVSDEVRTSAYRPRKRHSTALHSPSFSSDPDDSDRSTFSTADEFFHPTDLLDEQLLPSRLPKSLVKRSPIPRLGKDMEQFQRRIHDMLNSIAGLQVKMAALQEFVTTHKDEHELVKATDRNEGDLLLRKRRKSPSPDLPLSHQPLRISTADKVVAGSVAQAQALVAQKKKRSGERQVRKTLGKAKPACSPPRKKARENLDAILAMPGEDREEEGEEKREVFGSVVVGAKRRKSSTSTGERTSARILPGPNEGGTSREKKRRVKGEKGKLGARSKSAPSLSSTRHNSPTTFAPFLLNGVTEAEHKKALNALLSSAGLITPPSSPITTPAPSRSLPVSPETDASPARRLTLSDLSTHRQSLRATTSQVWLGADEFALDDDESVSDLLSLGVRVSSESEASDDEAQAGSEPEDHLDVTMDLQVESEHNWGMGSENDWARALRRDKDASPTKESLPLLLSSPSRIVLNPANAFPISSERDLSPTSSPPPRSPSTAFGAANPHQPAISHVAPLSQGILAPSPLRPFSTSSSLLTVASKDILVSPPAPVEDNSDNAGWEDVPLVSERWSDGAGPSKHPSDIQVGEGDA